MAKPSSLGRKGAGSGQAHCQGVWAGGPVTWKEAGRLEGHRPCNDSQGEGRAAPKHVAFGREELGPFSPAFPSLVMSPPDPSCSAVEVLLPPSSGKASPGLAASSVRAEVFFRSWFPPTGITYALLNTKCSTGFRIINKQTNYWVQVPRNNPSAPTSGQGWAQSLSLKRWRADKQVCRTFIASKWEECSFRLFRLGTKKVESKKENMSPSCQNKLWWKFRPPATLQPSISCSGLPRLPHTSSGEGELFLRCKQPGQRMREVIYL